MRAKCAELDALLTLGVDRVLTSGGAATALEGAATIRRMVEAAGLASGLTRCVTTWVEHRLDSPA